MNIILPIFLGVIFALVSLYFFLIMPILSLIELSQTDQVRPGSKLRWLIFIILLWPFTSALFLMKKGSSSIQRVSGKFFFVFITLLALGGGILIGNLKPRLVEVLETDAASLELRNRSLLTSKIKKSWAEKLKTLATETNELSITHLETFRIHHELHEFFVQLAMNEDLSSQDYDDWNSLYESRKTKNHQEIQSYLSLYKRRPPIPLEYDSYPASSKRKEVKLSLGESYLGTDEPMELSLKPAVEFDGKTKEEVKEIRTTQVKLVEPYLQTSEYQPSDAVFGQIFDFKPWVGEIGEWVHGPGEKIAEGNSELSKSILNPLALIWPSIRFGIKDGQKLWNEKLIESDKLLKRAGAFPLALFPSKLLWYPKTRKAVLQYDISRYKEVIKKYQTLDLESIDWNLNLNTTNAVDLGFNYWFLNENKSTHVSAGMKSKVPLRTAQFFQTTKDCKMGDGCNSLSPVEPELNSLQLNSFPAMVQLDLWNSFEQNAPTQPDFSFILDFQVNGSSATPEKTSSITDLSTNPTAQETPTPEPLSTPQSVMTPEPEKKAPVASPVGLSQKSITSVVKGDLEGLESELKKGLDINAKGNNGMRLLHFAANYSQVKTILFLLEHGADLHAIDNDQSMAIHYAAYKGNIETLKLLLSKGAKLNAIDQEGLSPLGYAKLSKNEEKIKILLDAGAK